MRVSPTVRLLLILGTALVAFMVLSAVGVAVAFAAAAALAVAVLVGLGWLLFRPRRGGRTSGA
jgi:hypothetical protein